MAATDQDSEYISLTPLFGQNSMEAFLQALTEDRRCMDCKSEIEEFEGAMAFSGQLPSIELAGHICEKCWEWRKTLRRMRVKDTAM